VIELFSEDRIDGLAAHLGDEKVVVLNIRLPFERTRLNAAHELGHHLFDDACQEEGVGDTDIEKRAFEFASNFLLPENKLRQAFEGYSMIKLVEFKERFGVSLAAMIYRAKALGVIDGGLYQRLWMQFSKRGWRTKEPGVVLPDRATRFERMLESAIAGDATSWQETVKLTGVREEELRERLDLALPSSGKGWAMK
jgi:Zn-dependent peptidase ImmA (M78 family)